MKTFHILPLLLVAVQLLSGGLCEEPGDGAGETEMEPTAQLRREDEEDDGIKRPDVRDPNELVWAAQSAENSMRDYGKTFYETVTDIVLTKQETWVHYMQRAAEENTAMNYTTRRVAGKMEVESVNGVVARFEDATTWAVIFLQVVGDDCRIPQSVEKFFPIDDDHILLKLITKEEAKKIPICFWPIKDEDKPPVL